MAFKFIQDINKQLGLIIINLRQRTNNFFFRFHSFVSQINFNLIFFSMGNEQAYLTYNINENNNFLYRYTYLYTCHILLLFI